MYKKTIYITQYPYKCRKNVIRDPVSIYPVCICSQQKIQPYFLFFGKGMPGHTPCRMSNMQSECFLT